MRAHRWHRIIWLLLFQVQRYRLGPQIPRLSTLQILQPEILLAKESNLGWICLFCQIVLWYSHRLIDILVLQRYQAALITDILARLVIQSPIIVIEV